MKRLLIPVFIATAGLVQGAGHSALASSSGSQVRAVTPTMLAIARGVFAPAKVIKSIVDPNSNNVKKNVWPRDEHSEAYTVFGRVNGYYIDAKWKLAGGKSITFEYDGSIFKSSAGAQQAWHDGSTYDLKFKGTHVLTCPSGMGAHCTRLTALFTTGDREVYDVIQQGQCISEARAKATENLINGKRSRIYATLGKIDKAAFNAMSLSCGS